MMAAGKQMNQTVFRDRTILARNGSRRRNRTVTGFSRPSCTSRPCIKDYVLLDPCMGSGHILVYAFDVLMEIYRECGYSDWDAAESILQNNLYGLDIDSRAYQIAYFAVMMRARRYDRRALTKNLHPHIYPLCESCKCNIENEDLQYLMDEFSGVQQYGSLIDLKRDLNLDSLQQNIDSIEGQLSLSMVDIPVATSIIKVARILMNQYCVVCTNPPYLNKMNPVLKDYILKHYKDYSGDLFSVFMYKNFDYCKAGGYSAFMTPFVWMFIKTYEPLRKYIIENKSITTLVQMEYSAFEEATVPICTFVLKNGRSTEKGLYFKLSDFKGGMEVQKQKVLEAIANKDCGYFYEASAENFSKIPGMPIAYWVSNRLKQIFNTQKSLSEYANTRRGLQTGDSGRFIRLWFEVPLSNFYLADLPYNKKLREMWFPLNSGGPFRRWYGNIENVVNWANDGFDIKATGKAIIPSEDKYFQPVISWNKISSGKISVRFQRQGVIPGDASPFLYSKDTDFLKYAMGIMNSCITTEVVKAISPTINFEVGNIAKIPVVYTKENMDKVLPIIAQNIALSKIDWDSFETSWDFKAHPLITYATFSVQQIQNELKNGFNTLNTLEDAYKNWSEFAERQFLQLKSNEEGLNRIFIDIYGLQDELTPEVADKDVTVARIYDTKEEIPESMKGNNYVLTKCDVIKSFLSYAVGCMFGRYSLDVPGLAYAGGEWDDSKYSSFLPDKDNILPITDEAYFEDDIVGRFVNFVKAVYGEETLEENLGFIANALGNKGNTSREVIRNYFLNDFFKDHCKTYKKRPIYWLFDSGRQNGFKALIYLHRYNENTIGNLRIDYLHRMERVYESEITRMQDTIDNSANGREVTAATKRKEKLQKQIKECKEYDEKIAHLALARIAIDLDDGVKVNYEKVQTDTDGKFYQVLAKI